MENEKELDSGEHKEILPKEAFVYRRDVVILKTDETMHGSVLEVAGDYDSDDTTSDDSDIEDEIKTVKWHQDVGGNSGDSAGNTVDDDDHCSLPDDQVRVAWNDGNTTKEDIDRVRVVDRSFFPGDIVASASDPTGQLGFVVDVSLVVDLQRTPNGDIISGVSSKDLKRIRTFDVGDYVVSGPWLGRVDEVLDNVNVLFDDGSVCKVSRADPLRLKPVSRTSLHDEICPYYPGQRVKAASSSIFKTSRWLNGFWKASRLEGTVIKVETVSVVVYWIASANFGTSQASFPPDEQHPKNLTLLSCFSHANWQFGDWCFVPSLASEEHTENSSVACLQSSDQVGPGLDVQNEGTRGTDKDGMGEQNVQSASDGEQAGGFNSAVSVAPTLNVDHGAEPKILQEFSSADPSSTSQDPAHDYPTYRKKLKKIFFKRDRRTRRRDENFERALIIVNTATKVDVAWQDGTKEYGLDSTSLIPIHNPNDHEFFPEQYIVEKVSNEEENDSTARKRAGLVRFFDAKNRTVSVRWLKPSLQLEKPKEFEGDEVVSAYDLDLHRDYDYCYGDVVVRLPSVSNPGESTNSESTLDKHGESTNSESTLDKQGKQSNSVRTDGNPSAMHVDSGKAEQNPQNESYLEFIGLTWVGNIVGFKGGDIEVKWGDDTVSQVGPHEIYVVGRDDDTDSLDDGSDISDDGASWETVDENEMDVANDSEKEGDSQDPTDGTNEKVADTANHQESSSQSGLSAVFGFVHRLASGIMNRGKKSVSDAIDDNESQESQEDSDTGDNEASGDLDVNEVTEGEINEAKVEENHEASMESTVVEMKDSSRNSPSMRKSVGVDGSDAVDSPHFFKHFDVVQSPADHHFLESTAQGTGGRKWVKKVQQEWNILEKNLPEEIYLRVYEDRMDLIRAVIVGASGTPYQDGLFFFDFHLPPDYPQVPPSAFYHSGGLRVNPNLYVDGKVCLSLLNTWTGKGTEVWDPTSSSILQVLVSIQGLVLNARPYFNEAGYEKQVGTAEGEKNSLPYSENTYLLCLKSMMYLLRRPPVHFEDFIQSHFRRRGPFILKACEAYLQGCSIGSLTDDASPTEKSKEETCSVGFKLALVKILPRLISALKDAGANCEQFEHLQESKKLQEF